MTAKVFIDTVIFRMQRIGGVSVYWSELIRRMAADPTLEVTLVDSPGSSSNILFPEIAQQVQNVIPERTSNLFLQRISRVRLSERDAQGAIFHGTYYRTATGGASNVLTIHDFTHQLLFKGRRRLLNDELKRRAIEKADAIVCISEHTKGDLLRFFPSARDKDIRVVYNGADAAYRPIADADVGLSRFFPELGQRPFLMYVGDRSPYKNFAYLDRIMPLLPEFDVVVAGGKPFTQAEQIIVSGWNGQVLKYEGLDNVQLNLLYNCAHALVYPSLYEGFGIPVLEAMKAGCPVIAFNNSALPEVLGESPLLLNNNDIAGGVAALELLKDESFASEIKGYQAQRAKLFDWDVAYRKIRNIYLSLTSEHICGSQIPGLSVCDSSESLD